MKIGNHKGKLAIAGLAALFLVACVAPLPGFERIDPPEYSSAIPLQPEAGTGGGEQWYRTKDSIVVRNVRQPELIAFLPDPGKATGAAVIVLPGGAFQILSMSAEGTDVAQLLADRGIAAFVLKYRLNETPANDLLFGAKIAGMLSKLADGAPIEVSEPKATADALAALRLLDAEADKWSLDRDRIGMIGFSAGAMTVLNVVEEDTPLVPDFAGYIYGPMDADLTADNLPPMLAAIARDDELIHDRSFSFVDRWRERGGEAELHVYQDGGHGFGLGRQGTDSVRFREDLLDWLERQISAGDVGR
ncbi:dienelactone hydrolase family protein [Citromicrobium bathyomarinum]